MASVVFAETYPTGMINFGMQKDKDNCSIYSPIIRHPFLGHPVDIDWTGECENGFAVGHGTINATYEGIYLYTSSYTDDFKGVITFESGYPESSPEVFARLFLLENYGQLFNRTPIRCPDNGKLDFEIEGIPMNGLPRGDPLVSLIIGGFLLDDINSYCQNKVTELNLHVFSRGQHGIETIFEATISGEIRNNASVFDQEYSLRHSDRWQFYFEQNR